MTIYIMTIENSQILYAFLIIWKIGKIWRYTIKNILKKQGKMDH